MDPRWKHLLDGGVILCHGEEKLLQRRSLEGLLEEGLNPLFADFNRLVFDGESLDEEALFDAWDTLPLMDRCRILVVKDVMGFLEHNEQGSKELLARIQNPSPGCLVVFTEEGKNIDRKLRIIKALLKVGSMPYDSLTPPQLRQFLEEELVTLHASMVPGAMETFIEGTKYFNKKTDIHLDDVVGELKKVAHAAAGQPIDNKVIESQLLDVLDQNVFDFMEELSNGRGTEALKTLKKILEGGDDIYRVFPLIVRQVRLLLWAKCLLEEGTPAQSLGKILGAPPFAVKRIANQQRAFSQRFLRTAYEELARIDVRMKTGFLSPELLIEMWVLRFVRGKRKS